MKTFILAIATVIFTTGAYAQTDRTNKHEDRSNKQENSSSQMQQPNDGYIYQNGQMSMVKKGKITRVDKDTKLSDGTIIKGNGDYTDKNGTKKKFKEGEHMDWSGKMTPQNSSTKAYDNKDQNYPDGYVYQNGKVMNVKNGKMTAIDKDTKLDNGTVIKGDGNYTNKDGSKMRLKDGEHLDSSGKMTPPSRSNSFDNKENQRKNNDMFLKRDSTNHPR